MNHSKKLSPGCSEKVTPFFYLLLFVLIASCSHSSGNSNAAALNAGYEAPADWPESFGLGRAAADSEIAKLDTDVRPDGKGLPPGSGNASTGRNVYAVKCASCHGTNGSDGPFARLVGPIGDTVKAKTIGNYWPYSTTVFDYIKRTMPYNAPGTLSDDEVYSLTAYLLSANKIIDSTMQLNDGNLFKVVMPARQYFVTDDRQGGKEIR